MWICKNLLYFNSLWLVDIWDFLGSLFSRSSLSLFIFLTIGDDKFSLRWLALSGICLKGGFLLLQGLLPKWDASTVSLVGLLSLVGSIVISVPSSFFDTNFGCVSIIHIRGKGPAPFLNRLASLSVIFLLFDGSGCRRIQSLGLFTGISLWYFCFLRMFSMPISVGKLGDLHVSKWSIRKIAPSRLENLVVAPDSFKVMFRSLNESLIPFSVSEGFKHIFVSSTIYSSFSGLKSKC